MGWFEDAAAAGQNMLNTTTTFAQTAGDSVVAVSKIVGTTEAAVGLNGGTSTWQPVTGSGQVVPTSPTTGTTIPAPPTQVSASGTFFSRLGQKLGLPVWATLGIVCMSVLIFLLITWKLIKKAR